MARPEPPEAVESSGQDSFLDVVTNIVGILIILVMVTGLRAQRAPVQIAASAPDPTILAAPQTAVSGAQGDLKRADQEVKAVEASLADRNRQREVLATYISAGELQLNQAQQKLGETDQVNLQMERAVAVAQLQLAEKKQQYAALINYEPPPAELQNVPTPLSRTVVGHEVQYHLKQGCVALVPLDELLDEVRRVLRNARSVDEIKDERKPVGPANGFYLRYRLTVGSDNRSISLNRCRIEPEKLPIGEALPAALADRSAFRQSLRSLNPKIDSITIWFYADSFNEFRVLRQELHRLGFACAGRPLSDDNFIEAAPDGSKSAAE